MVMTILEARVAPEKWGALEQAYREGIVRLDAGITQTFLVHSSADLALWRILTVWRNREALEDMRRSGETPRGVNMFRAAGAEPILSVLDVAAHAEADVYALSDVH
jgi:Antibiotic biosynthesis monooxygenase